MKTNLQQTFLALLFVLSLISCDNNPSNYTQTKPAATGNPGEILVVMTNTAWEGEIGKALRDVFHEDLYTVPQEEFIFDLYQIEKTAFIDLNKRNRNVIIPEIGEGVEQGEIKLKKDVYSTPQTVIYIKAPDIASFIETCNAHSKNLIETFKKADRERLIPYLKKYYIEKYSEQIADSFGVFFTVPRSYTFDENRENFAWLSYETRHASQGFFVYRYPADSTSSPNLEYLIAMRNEVLKVNVPGERKDSYMTTETKYHYPILTGRIVNEQNCWVMEGLWKVENDFMGGPFISFTMLDETTNEYVTIEAYVYDPRGDNRDQIRKLEASLWTMELI
jgi:hypothetical protein